MEAKIKAIAPWFGSNRMLAPAVGEELAGCRWVGVPFAGGMAELLYINAPTIVVSDLHKHVINLALCIKCPTRREQLISELSDSIFHPDALELARVGCRAQESRRLSSTVICSGSVDWAVDYFIASWMNRSGKSGTDDEFKGKIPVRWNANGGDSNTRFRSAVQSLASWASIMWRCNFVVQDAFDFLDNTKDESKHGLYLDPPFPGPGDDYRHKFTEQQHRDMAAKLAGFKECRIVCRFYDHPLVRELYPEGDKWTWRRLNGRDQSNNAAKPEVLIINGPSYAKG